MTTDDWFPPLDLSRIPRIVAGRCAQLDIDLSKCEPGSTRVLKDSPGYLRIFVGYAPTFDLGTISMLALSTTTEPGTLN